MGHRSYFLLRQNTRWLTRATLFFFFFLSSPKIQRLVTPLRLQRRRHLRALKIRRLEHQKEQKTEYECVIFVLPPFLVMLLTIHFFFSALIAKRIAEKKEKVAAIKASHKKYVFLYLHFGLRVYVHPKIAGQPRGRFLCRVVLYILIRSRCHMALYTHVLFLYISYFPDAIPYAHDMWPGNPPACSSSTQHKLRNISPIIAPSVELCSPVSNLPGILHLLAQRCCEHNSWSVNVALKYFEWTRLGLDSDIV